MKKFFLILTFLTCFVFASVCAKTQQEEYQNDLLYSEEYFDYLIECAEVDQKRNLDEDDQISLSDEIVQDDNNYIIFDDEPLKLRIAKDVTVDSYRETYKKINSKTIIPVSDNLSFFQDMSKVRNKYNSNDYKMYLGAQYSFMNFLNVASGLETNYRGYDQNPQSRKLYLTPSLSLGDKFSVSFHNKMNIQNYSSDHDIGLNISPLKSKALDFGVYAGTTRSQSGAHSESVNFSTNFYFF